MENIEKKATRTAYGEALADLGDEKNFLVFDADLSKSTMTATFAEKFPERFINCGIAEANMISAAAGAAAYGLPAFVSSFAMFAVGRGYEQIRNSVAYPNLNVKICASHAGITVGEDGATHQFCEDIAIMRSMPNMRIIVPADAVEAYYATKYALEIDGPVYIRFGRYAIPVINKMNAYKFEYGKGITCRDGTDAVIFATGICVAEALEAAELLKEKGIDAAVINIHTIKPIDKDIIIDYARKCKNVITAEEHSVIGGLGSAVAEVLAENCISELKSFNRIGINDIFGRSGKAGELVKYYGLDSNSIAEKIVSICGNKA